jgi:hypothetical protein
LGSPDSLAEAGDVKVVFTGGFEDGSVLLTDITFMIFITGGFPDGSLRLGHERLLLLETLEFVDEKAGDHDDDSRSAGDEDWVRAEVLAKRYPFMDSVLFWMI